MSEYFERLAIELPPVIIVAKTPVDNKMNNFIMQNGYKKVWEEKSTKNGAIAFARTYSSQVVNSIHGH